MNFTNDGFELESTGKKVLTFGNEGLSLDDSNQMRFGYDGYIEYYDDSKEEYKVDFTDEEKKEIAKYVIERWARFAGLSIVYK
jgi:hypothetical protein